MATNQVRIRLLRLFLGVFFAVLLSCGYLSCQAERSQINDSGISPTVMMIPGPFTVSQ